MIKILHPLLIVLQIIPCNKLSYSRFDVHFWDIAQQSESLTDVCKGNRNISGLRGQLIEDLPA